MIQKLADLLKYLNDTLDYGHQQKVENLHRQILNWEEVERLPLIMAFPYPAEARFQPFPHREIFDNPEKMLFNELTTAWGTSIALRKELNDDLPLTIRANFGTVLIASIFGGNIGQTGDNPPWVRSFSTVEEFQSSMKHDPLDFSQGWCPKVFGLYSLYHQILEDYQNLKKCLQITLPDMQGPIDTLELLRGSEVFIDFYMQPELITNSLQIISQAQIGFANKLKDYTCDGPEGYCHQHGFTVKGNILIRNDSSMMLSPDLYEQYVAPFDSLVIKSLWGGGIHSCGKINHIIGSFLNADGVQCFDFGQSYLNDIDEIYTMAREKRIPLIRIQPEKEELISGEICKRFSTGVSLFYEAKSFDEAKYLVQKYKKTT